MCIRDSKAGDRIAHKAHNVLQRYRRRVKAPVRAAAIQLAQRSRSHCRGGAGLRLAAVLRTAYAGVCRYYAAYRARGKQAA